MFSALSRLQDDSIRFRSCFLKGYSLYVSITTPITIFAGVFAKDILSVALGPQWTESIVIFQLLAPAVLVLGMINPMAWLLFSTRRHVRSLKISLVIAALIVTGCLAGLPYGPEGVAIGFSAVLVVWLPAQVVWCAHGTPISTRDILRALSRPLLAAIIATLLAYIVEAYAGPMPSPTWNLIMVSSVMAAAYAFLMIAVGKELYADLLQAARDRPERDGLASSLSVPPG
jgi:PST family polysaccharide transporter